MAASDVGPRGSRGDQESQTQGPSQAVRLTWRLSGRSTFQALRSDGIRARGSCLTLTWLDDGSTPPRLGFAIGKVVGTAVQRNRLRRRLRAVVAEMARQSQLAPGCWLISAGPRAKTRSGTELQAELTNLVDRCRQRS